ncbi:hypothetical protein BN1232_06131 [Mycobacterium lentiflavum]|uniref:DNA primase n=1 Tax=Mycobacterium lentiflavum TaxID=141349 RepID=A0A0E4H2R1_MYCLN|nr:hypothetical protein [Mycobacterium lentiflavum]CQD24264.1 hypothetical protein BN1232_06131 [Mycobacterium lentiflavum]
MSTSTATTGAAFTVVRDAIEATGALTRSRAEHSLMASCPLHNDADPSLSVTWKPRPHRAGGAVLLHCFSCGADAAAIAAAIGLRMSDLFDEPPPSDGGRLVRTHPVPRPTPKTVAPQPQPQHQWTRVRVYTYTTERGRPVQQVIRQECRCSGTIHKRFLQRYRDARRWVWTKPVNFTPVLYRAPALACAPADQWVWLTEGEKDADTAARLGKLATTNAQGANNFPPELAAELAGRDVAIVIDRDRAGYQRALALCEQLDDHARRLVLLLPAITEPKADLTDHVNAGLWKPGEPFGGLTIASRAQLEQLHAAYAPSTGAGSERTVTSCSPRR